MLFCGSSHPKCSVEKVNIFVDKTSPPGSYPRVPPLGPTIGSHPKVPPQVPNLGSHLRALVPESHLKVLGPTFPFCRLQLYQKETPIKVFSCEYSEIFKTSFFIEKLWWLLPHKVPLMQIRLLLLPCMYNVPEAKRFAPNNLFTINLADFLITTHSIFLFEIKQRAHYALLMLQILLTLTLCSQ